jgi:uncharacterized cupin superfamily protein
MAVPVIHVSEAEGFANQPKAADGTPSTRFGSRMAPFSDGIGARELGAIYMEVEPGRRAFPYHLHHGNEEMFVILDGEGTYRFDGREYPIRAGCVCAAPRGEGSAHQIVNTGSRTLRYLSISTRNDPDVIEYPDSGKFMAIGLGRKVFPDAAIREVGRRGESLAYFDGEEM